VQGREFFSYSFYSENQLVFEAGQS